MTGSPHALASLCLAAASAFAEVDFVRDVRPIFEKHCYECHGPEKQKSGYRLDVRDVALRGGDSGDAAIAAHDAKKSPLIRYVSGEDEEMLMPPKKTGKPRLTEAEVNTLRTWINEGPNWPDGSAGASEVFNLGARKERLPWIWQTPQRQTVPGAPGSTDVDRFLFAKMRAKELTPAPPADDLTWLRRAHFTITGLPPRRAAMQAFLADTSKDRRERVVDALLASPHFGERWARHWMDVVRYAESRGHEEDFPIANAWQYRDYLIRALNADVPYDRFVAEHVAGDLLPARLDARGANESVLATGWAFLGEEIHNPVDIRQDECERVDNKVDVFSKAFLGLTVACARCHDHKFDAITQRDYYALSGFVLGSPFRQVRFETMEQHARAAEQLAGLRTRQAGKIAAALAEAVRPGTKEITPYLMAARRVLFGGKAEVVAAETGLVAARVSAWLEHLKLAVAETTHPLHAFTMLMHEPDAEKAARFPGLLAKQTAAVTTMPAGTTVIADFTSAGRTPWKSDGPSFGMRALSAGEVVLGHAGASLIRVMPYGAASRDAFWNKLKLSQGTEMDSGNLGAAARAGRTLLTPKFTIATGKLHFLLRGKAQLYAGVDSHIMLVGGLHGALLANFDTGGKLKWITHDLSAYAGHRAHLEFSPQGDAELDVLMIVESPERPVWLPVQQWSPKADVPSLLAVAESLQADFGKAADGLASGKAAIEPRLAPLADWLVRNPAPLGANTAPAAAAATVFFREQEALAKTVRWDSHTAASWADGTGVDERILIRGKPARPGEIANRRLPEAFGLPPVTTADSSGRAELARQLTDPSNPLATRVIVNRVWHHVFGRGIVPTVDNFGYLGERPTHPELLDHLAWQFIHEDHWSLKKLIRRLTLTDAFARSSRTANMSSSEVDPSNLLLHRYPVRRLEGEAIRDALLVISGRLDAKLCGPPVHVHLTDFIVGRGRPESGPLDGAGRRSIYIAARRNFLPTMMLAFDLPTPFSTVGRRNVTNVPAQTLVMMNDPFVREQAAAWSTRLLRELPKADAAERVAWLFETAMTRPPTEEEAHASLKSLDELRTLHAPATDAVVWSEFCHAVLNANDFIYLK